MDLTSKACLAHTPFYGKLPGWETLLPIKIALNYLIPFHFIASEVSFLGLHGPWKQVYRPKAASV